MRICFFSQEDLVRPQGGTGTYVRNMCIALAARGHDIHAIVRQRDNASDIELTHGVTVHRVWAPGPPVLYSPLYFRKAREKFMQLSSHISFDAIQGNMPLMSSWGLQSTQIPPLIETVHCTVAEELRAISHTSMQKLNLNEVLSKLLAGVLRKRERYMLQRARSIIAVSSGLKKELMQQGAYPAGKITVIPNGIDYSHFAHNTVRDRDRVRESLGIGPDEPMILYLGRLMERKRVIDLVQALPLIQQQFPHARLVIVGKRTPNALRIEQMAHELGITQSVIVIDHVPYVDVPLYYAAADVYALPSAYEGFPFTILEAMASGTPVVASRIPGIDEQIISGKTGLLHAVGNIVAIAEQIIRMLEDRPFAQQLAATAQKMVEEHYNWEVIGARTEHVFESVVA